MKVLLIYPPTTVYGEDPSKGGQVVPLGLAYLAAVCEQNQYETRILDFSASDNIEENPDDDSIYYGTPAEEIKKQIKEFAPDIVGIQCMYTAYANDAYAVARVVKEINSETLVVMGGAHASSCPEAVLENPQVDLAVIGEGEATFLDIISRYGSQKSLSGILGTAARVNGKMVINPPRPYIDDIDTIPFPARHLLPLERYIEKFKNAPFNMRPATFVITSRGCPCNCRFCSIKSVWGRTWRCHSPKRVVDEIEQVVRDYGVGEIHFVDDNISTKIERLVAICDELLRRKLDIKWATPNGIAIWTLTNEALNRMKKSGCYRLTFGIETACEATRKYIRKQHASMEKMKQIIAYANRLGIWTISTFILGFPQETREDIEETVGFALKSDLDFAFFFLPMPFPNTDLTADYIQSGLLGDLREEEWGAFLSGTHGVATRYFTVDQLRNIQKDSYFRFIRSRFMKFLNPLRIIGKIKSLEDFKYVCKLGKAGIRYFLDTFKRRKNRIYRVGNIGKNVSEIRSYHTKSKFGSLPTGG
jgi:anaerobic magnesium-protoporphyrin IX monomethyl ester cyclase